MLFSNFLGGVDSLIYAFAGPFIHCDLFVDTATKIKRITINKKSNEIKIDKQLEIKQPNLKRSFVKLTLTQQEWLKLDATFKAIMAHKTEFDLSECLGFKSFHGRVTTEKKAWFCSSLIVFLLKECGFLDKEINPIKVSVTMLYLLLHRAKTLGKKVEMMKTNPFKKEEIESPEEIYCEYMGIYASEIPLPNVQNLKLR